MIPMRYVLQEDKDGRRYWAAFHPGGDVEVLIGHEGKEIFPLDLKFTTEKIIVDTESGLESRVPTGTVIEVSTPLIERTGDIARCTVCDISMRIDGVSDLAAKMKVFETYHREKCDKK